MVVIKGGVKDRRSALQDILNINRCFPGYCNPGNKNKRVSRRDRYNRYGINSIENTITL